MNFYPTFPRLGRLFPSLMLLALLLQFSAVRLTAAEQRGVRVVVIDAGHGGPKYPGATYGGHHEKNINLQVALKLGKLIEEQMSGVKVIYTRTTDKQFSSDLNADLQARADIANKAEADLFISIHANAARSTAARGLETLIMGESEKETRLNESVLYANNKEEFLDMSDERTAAIVRAYIQNLQFTYGRYSEALARIVQKNYVKAGYHDRGIKRQPLKVLYATDMPSILTEIGFMSNAAELKQMTSSKGQMAIAQALLQAVKDYAAYVEDTLLEEEAQSEDVQTEPAADKGRQNSEKRAETIREEASESGKESQNEKLQQGYTIQLLASTKRISLASSELKGYRNRCKEYTASGRYGYKYCYGAYVTKQEASKALAEVRKSFKDAYVVHFAGTEIK